MKANLTRATVLIASTLGIVIFLCGSYGAGWLLNFEAIELFRSARAGPSGSPRVREALEPFNLNQLTVPRGRLVSGGSPKDGIPSLTDPPTAPVARADFLKPGDRVIGVTIHGKARAYPLAVLNWHEVINDTLGDVPIAVVYCPLCNSVSVVDRRIDGKTLEFGVSGLLLNSNVVLYDRTDQALWSQVGMEALSGPYAGQSLRHLPWTLTTFGDWRRRHPDGAVVTFDTGYRRNYQRNPYARYLRSPNLMFPVRPLDRRLPLKARVVGVRVNGTTKVYPLHAIAAVDDGRLVDEIGGERIVLAHTGAGVRVVSAPPDAEVIHTFWFAWAAFHPETDIYGRADKSKEGAR